MIAYLDTPSGISGDMFLSCLVDAGWHIDAVRQTLAGLHLPAEEYSIDAKEITKGPLRATQVTVKAVRTMHQRRLGDIIRILERSTLTDTIRTRAKKIFHTLAQSEAAVHGTSVNEVHFHEVGAVDAIVDIVAAAAGVEALGISKLYCSPLPLCHGWINSDHGPLPLPAPATLHILTHAYAPTRLAPGEGELVTPTGAAIVATLATFSQPPMTLSRIATGAGQKDFPWPNVARLWLGKPLGGTATDQVIQIDTNIDDMNPQFFLPLINKLSTAGALDVWITPIQMKKARPGSLLSVLATPDKESELSTILLTYSTTFGVRITPQHRRIADRRIETIQTQYGPVRVKIKILPDGTEHPHPEYEDCQKLAAQNHLPVEQIYTEVARASRP